MAVEQHSMPADASEKMIYEDTVVKSVEEQKADNVEVSKTPEKPSWLQDKFQTPEDLAKAYDELERKLGSKPQAPNQDTAHKQESAPQEQTETPNRSSEDQSAPLLPGLDNNTVEQISDYAWQNQGLTDEHYNTLEQAGYSREMVDAYMTGQFAQAEQGHNALMEAGGGEANVESMFGWAQQNLSEQQISAYDEMFDRGGPEAVMAMENLKAKYDAAGGSSAWQGVTGANAPSVETSAFQSSAEVIDAMSDPRYQRDPAYRDAVMKKLQRSGNII